MASVSQIYDAQPVWLLAEVLCTECGCLDLCLVPWLLGNYPRNEGECSHCREWSCTIEHVWDLDPMPLAEAEAATQVILDGELEDVFWCRLLEVV